MCKFLTAHQHIKGHLVPCGICSTLLIWLQNVFQNRTSQTRVGQSVSIIAQPISEIIQGSTIGPLIFVIFFCELICILERHGIKVKLFADDVKIYRKCDK